MYNKFENSSSRESRRDHEHFLGRGTFSVISHSQHAWQIPQKGTKATSIETGT